MNNDKLQTSKVARGWRITLSPFIRKKLKLEIGDHVAFDEEGKLIKVKTVPVRE